MEKGGRKWGKYREERDKYKRICERKKKKEVERWEREIREVKTEAQVGSA